MFVIQDPGAKSNLFLTDKVERTNKLSFPKNLKKSVLNINEKRADEEDDLKKSENIIKQNSTKNKQYSL